MADEALHTVVDEMTPQITELAQYLGQTPEEFLREVVEERRKQWALAKLDEEVAKAEASGFHIIEDFGDWKDEVRARSRARRS